MSDYFGPIFLAEVFTDLHVSLYLDVVILLDVFSWHTEQQPILVVLEADEKLELRIPERSWCAVHGISIDI